MSHPCAPEQTAVRTALWRALHAEVDRPPHVLTDSLGAKLVGEKNWQQRPDMDADFSRMMRASVVGRQRFIEDLVAQKHALQYVILGAGLDTYAQRHPELARQMQVFEVDQPGPQQWKRKRLEQLGFSAPEWLHFVPVDFEAGQSWWEQLRLHEFDEGKPAVVVSTGVSMYLTREANLATLEQVAALAPGSTLAMTFMLALELLGDKERETMRFVMTRAAESGVPFISLFTPAAMLALAKDAGFKTAEYVSGEDLYRRYFAGRTDGLRAGTAEVFLLAGT